MAYDAWSGNTMQVWYSRGHQSSETSDKKDDKSEKRKKIEDGSAVKKTRRRFSFHKSEKNVQKLKSKALSLPSGPSITDLPDVCKATALSSFPFLSLQNRVKIKCKCGWATVATYDTLCSFTFETNL